MPCTACRQPLTVPLTNVEAGMVQGPYWIQKSLGPENLGERFAAKATEGGTERYLLTVISPAVQAPPAQAEAFLNGLTRAAPVEHEWLVPVCDTGQIRDCYYYALPHVDGQTLGARLAGAGTLTVKTALKLVLRMARALEALWDEAGIVHGYLNPEVIVIDDENKPHILGAGFDFARLLGPEGSLQQINWAGTVADCLCPELIQGETDPDCRSDIYSLGVILFAMLTGQMPYAADTAPQLAHMHLNEKIPNPRRFRPKLPPEVMSLMGDMLRKDRDRRLQSWRYVIGEVKGILRASSPGAETAGMVQTQRRRLHRGPDGTPARPNRSSNLVVALVAILVVLVAGVVGGLLLTRPKSPAANSSHSTAPAADSGEQENETRRQRKRPPPAARTGDFDANVDAIRDMARTSTSENRFRTARKRLTKLEAKAHTAAQERQLREALEEVERLEREAMTEAFEGRR
jgi:serine/threonine-protein kinase